MAPAHAEAGAAAGRALVLQERLHALALDDKSALEEFLTALALPRGTDAERVRRTEARSAALHRAGMVQRSVLEFAVEAAELGAAMFEHGPRTAAGDAATAVFLAAAAARSAYWAARSDADEGGAGAASVTADLKAKLERAESVERALRVRLEG